MQDNLGRKIEYLRVSVTDRCNLRCRYCIPEEGVPLTSHDEILSLEELGYIVDIGAELGIKRVRLTGGEPLMRRNLESLIAHIAANKRITDLALTTNGIRFSELALRLKEAGLRRVNISLDTLNENKYSYITRGGDLFKVLEAIECALANGFDPVKINTVVIAGFNDDEIMDLAGMAYRLPLHVRFIEFMPVGEHSFWDRERWIKSEDIKKELERNYELKPSYDIVGGGPASCYQLVGGRGTVGFISPLSNHFCHRCNRLRLTVQGMLLGCLHSEQGVDLKTPLRRGASAEEMKDLFLAAVRLKPGRHHLEEGRGQERNMSQIGG